ncbi:EscN/YscN/HrcN family type III secretion system ATPase, partial [Paraburkholderia sp. UYCP14C]
MHFDAQRLADAIEQEILSTQGIARTGKVLEVIGMLVKVAGLDVMLGEL